MTINAEPLFDGRAFLVGISADRSFVKREKNRVIFAQGERSDAVWFVARGRVKMAIVSPSGKEAVLAVLGEGVFFGEASLTGQVDRAASAVAMTDCSVARIEKEIMADALAYEPRFSQFFIDHLLARNMRIEEDLADQLFNSSEKRLARILLLLANFGKNEQPYEAIPTMSQATLAEMVGTTRSRVGFFLAKFARLGFIEYRDGLHVRSSLLNVLLLDEAPKSNRPNACRGAAIGEFVASSAQ